MPFPQVAEKFLKERMAAKGVWILAWRRPLPPRPQTLLPGLDEPTHCILVIASAEILQAGNAEYLKRLQPMPRPRS